MRTPVLVAKLLNALLDAAGPRIAPRLREILGADVGRLRFGRDTLEVHGARIRVGSGATATFDRVSVTRAKLTRAGGEVVIVLATERSELTIDARISPRGSVAGSRVRGRVSVAELFAIAGVPADVSAGASSLLTIDASLEGTLRAPRIVGAATGETVSIVAMGRALTLGEVRFSFEATRGASSATGTLAIVLARSRIAVDVCVDDAGALDGSRAKGRLEVTDALGLVPASGDLTLARRGYVDLDLAISGTKDAPALRGTLMAPLLEIVRRARPFVPGYPMRDLKVDVEATRQLVTLRDVACHVHGAGVVADAAIPLGPGAAPAEIHVRFDGASVDLVERLAEDASFQLSFPLPRDLVVGGDLIVAGDRSLRGDVVLTTAASRLVAALAIHEGTKLGGSTVRGTLGIADADACGNFRARLRPAPEGHVTIDAALRGTTTDPVLDGAATIPRARVVVHGATDLPSFVFERIACDFTADLRHLAWRGAAGHAYGGTFTSDGAISLSPPRLGAKLAWRDVRAERVPTMPTGESDLAGRLHGALSGAIEVERLGGDDRPVTGRGAGVLGSPEYLFVAAAAGPLRTYGLPIPAAGGAGPARANVRLTESGVHLDDVFARLEGIDVAGHLRAGFDGRVAGELRAELLNDYVQRSAVLAFPAVLAGRVTVPITLRGTLRRPIYDADLVRALGGMLRDNAVSDAVRGVVGDLLGALSQSTDDDRKRRR